MPAPPLHEKFGRIGEPTRHERGFVELRAPRAVIEDIAASAVSLWRGEMGPYIAELLSKDVGFDAGEELDEEDRPFDLEELAFLLSPDHPLSPSYVARIFEALATIDELEGGLESSVPEVLSIALLADAIDPARRDKPRLVAVSKETATAFVRRTHEHLPELRNQGFLYALGVAEGSRLVAVATVNTPSGAFRNPDRVVDLSRIASDGTVRGASSMLAARILDLLPRSGRNQPGTLLVTYSLLSEAGTTYLALTDKGLRPTRYLPPHKATGSRKGAGESALRMEGKIVWEAGPDAAPPDWKVLARTKADPERIAGAKRSFEAWEARQKPKAPRTTERAPNPTPTDAELENDLARFEREASDIMSLEFSTATAHERDALRDLVDRIYAAKGMNAEDNQAFRAAWQPGMAARVYAFYPNLKHWAGRLFRHILEARRLSPAMTKQVEKAILFWERTRTVAPRRAPVGVERMRLYFSLAEAIPRHIALAREAIRATSVSCDTVDVKVGRFTVKNAGCFPEKTVEEIVEVLRDVEKRMAALGLGALCYGDVILTKKVLRRSNYMAFYMYEDDKVYVRADKYKDDRVRVMCHELGHRLVHQASLRAGRAVAHDLRRLYNTIRDLDWKAMHDDLPKLGESVEIKDKKLGRVRLDVESTSSSVHDREPMVRARGHVLDDPEIAKQLAGRLRYTVPASAWFAYKGMPPKTAFVTPYARKNPEENYCEMLSFQAMNRLSPELTALMPGFS